MHRQERERGEWVTVSNTVNISQLEQQVVAGVFRGKEGKQTKRRREGERLTQHGQPVYV